MVPGLLWLCSLAFWATPAQNHPAQIRIPVMLLNHEGVVETTRLESKDFTVTLDGVPARLLGIRGPTDDLVVLVVLDLSGDLAAADPAKVALIAEIKKLPESAFVGLLSAQDSLKVLKDPTTDRDELAASIEAFPVSGKAGLLPTVEISCRIADSMLKKSSARVAVLYVTDSVAQNYREDFMNPVINSSDSHDLSREFPETLMRERISKLATGLASQQAPLFIAQLSYRDDRVNEEYQNGLKRLADTTGGAAAFSRSTTEIPGAITRCFELIAAHYSLTLALPDHLSASPLIRVAVPDVPCSLSYRTRFLFRSK